MKLGPRVKGPQMIRREDRWGCGAFDAPRGERRHRGIDIVANPDQALFSPITGRIVRVAEPYDDEPRYNGLLMEGLGEWAGLELKLFYLDHFDLGPIKQGDPLGTAQDIAVRYPGITGHIHVELRREGQLIDPTPFFDLDAGFS